MKREDKYPDTKCFKYYNANPFNKKSSDCVIRAICTVLNEDWIRIVNDLTELGNHYGYVCNDKHCYSKYLEKRGFKKCKQPRKLDNTKYTGEEWCDYLSNKYKRGEIDGVIAHIGGHHLVAIVMTDDGLYKVHDIWDSSDGCIGNYWIRNSTDNNMYI